jgi:beta-lactamase regulating signal transducer with metallopeptidase domain/prefoldin subunit 5
VRSPSVSPGVTAPVAGAPGATRWLDGAWVSWLGALLVIRDALSGLPSIPASLWLTGLLGLLLIHALRVACFRRQIARGMPAPRGVAHAVEQIAAKFGLRRPPETLMVESNFSPMLWCGRRTRLILPLRLWMQLDRAGRNAILCHELAHLKRRDHWVCRFELLVFALYWWHPVAWWVRRRLHEEADLSCDAWVTWLFPAGRKAYAQALLKTKQFISDGTIGVPAGGIRVTTAAARNLTRRLTMVMTQQGKPRLSMTGAFLAISLAILGWASTPARSCPPEEKPKAEAAKKAAPATAELKRMLELGAYRSAAPGGAETFRAFLARAGDPPGDPHRAEAVERLRAQIEALSVELNRLAVELEHVRHAGPHAPPPAGGSIATPAPPMLGAYPPEPVAPPQELPPAPSARVFGPGGAMAPAPRGEGGAGVFAGPRFAQPGQAVAPGGPGAGPWPTDTPAPPGGEGVVPRTYKFSSKGKLEAFTSLMVREDVPILVSPQGDAIQIQATPSQHAVIEAFIRAIDPHGDQAVPRRAPGTGRGRGGASGRAIKADQLRAKREDHETRARALEAQAEELHRQADQLNARVDELHRHADRMTAEAERSGSDERMVDAERAARGFQAEIRAIERQIQRVERQAEKLNAQAERFAETADSIELEIEELMEAEQPDEDGGDESDEEMSAVYTLPEGTVLQLKAAQELLAGTRALELAPSDPLLIERLLNTQPIEGLIRVTPYLESAPTELPPPQPETPAEPATPSPAR